MVQNFVVLCLGPCDKLNELVLGTRGRDAQKWTSKCLFVYVHMTGLTTKPEILIVVLPCMLTITQLLLQQNAHFYY
jgi:hypothetical protein